MLGIIDWGIGGISIYKLVKEQLGDVPVVYLSDTGATQYGKMARPELVERLNSVIDFLKLNGVTHLVIGCNAASTTVPFLNSNGIKIEGVIDTAVKVAAEAKPKSLGLIGGRRTVLSGVYRKAFSACGIEVKQRIAQPLSGLIESGDVSSDKLKTEAKRILEPLRNCSHILLACTHYPAIEPVLREFVSTDTMFIDPAASLVQIVKKWKLPEGGNDIFFTTGDAIQMKNSARLAFQVRIGKAKKVTI
ncbi:MAG TPA: aspartate/glutamate racemase family protein [Pyrinomonadaceae bacterium]|nr:aspartate/glutamate racemase family protein [Pyrinomonadaceae bacterium]